MDAAIAGLVGALGGALIGAIGLAAVSAITEYTASRRERRSLLFNQRVDAYLRMMAWLADNRELRTPPGVTFEEDQQEIRDLAVRLSLVGSRKVRGCINGVAESTYDFSRVRSEVMDELTSAIEMFSRVLKESESETDKEGTLDRLRSNLRSEIQRNPAVGEALQKYLQPWFNSNSVPIETALSAKRVLWYDPRIVRYRSIFDERAEVLEKAMQEDLGSAGL
jgi:hypothetical protein